MKQARKPKGIPLCNWRYSLLVMVVTVAFVSLIVRSAQLQIVNTEFWSHQADKNSLREKVIQSQRGLILDRHGSELARSVPSESVWINAKKIYSTPEVMQSLKWQKLASTLNIPVKKLNALVEQKKSKQKIWLNRLAHPRQSQMIHALDIDGVYLEAEQRRYYPAGENVAHIIGFTDVDGKGIEGLEKAYEQRLSGSPGRQKVVRNRKGDVIKTEDMIDAVKMGEDIQLSIDAQIQAFAYRKLKTAVLRHGASAGSLVILDVETGEILTMVNQPSFNPNRIAQRKAPLTRNRAVIDMYEPGSTAKPFTVISALEAGRVKPNTLLSTAPGKMKVGRYWVRDSRNLGRISVTEIIQKSSNVGVTRLALDLKDEDFLDTFYKLGFGLDTGSGFPGEISGNFYIRPNWTDFEKATVSYGYSFQVTPLQLAHAYATIASGGIKRQVSFLKTERPIVEERVFSKRVASQVLNMMETVVDEKGTAASAALASYRAAGKTGTARKRAKQGRGYGEEYVAVFAGVAPVSQPKIAMVVLIDEPSGEEYYGGKVAAPVFSEVAEYALRMLNVVPDKRKQVAHHDKL